MTVIYCPVPERLNFLLFIAVWQWYCILRILQFYKIDITSVVQVRTTKDTYHSTTHSNLIKHSYKFAVRLTKVFIPCFFLTTVIFAKVKENDLSSFGYIWYHALPLIQFIVILYMIIQESSVVKYCVKRLPLIEPSPAALRNVYILLSDSLTSFNRPLIDFTLFSSLVFMEPLLHLDLMLSSIPSLVRIFQCLREYKLVGHISSLANAMKYTCNLPILVCTWYARTNGNNLPTNFRTIQLWLYLINSTYSFFWDVRMDWHVNSLTIIRKQSKVYLNKQFFYYGIIIDFIIRYWWLWVILLSINEPKDFILFNGELHYLEIIRRANWIVFKIETEWSKLPTLKA